MRVVLRFGQCRRKHRRIAAPVILAHQIEDRVVLVVVRPTAVGIDPVTVVHHAFACHRLCADRRGVAKLGFNGEVTHFVIRQPAVQLEYLA